jgi:hypothetical protein
MICRRVRIWKVQTAEAARLLADVPVRVLVYPDDGLVPLYRSQEICRVAGWTDDCVLVYGAGHASGYDVDPLGYIADATRFYASNLIRSPGRSAGFSNGVRRGVAAPAAREDPGRA